MPLSTHRPPARRPGLGLLGGSFAPVHNGHLRMAIEARERLDLDAVHLLPAARNPHRPPPPVDGARRLAWLRLATEHLAGLQVDDRELRRPGPSYTVDSLRELREEHPEACLCLLLGMDAAEGLHTWNRASEIPALVNVVVFNRPGSADRSAPPSTLAWRGAGQVPLTELRRHAQGAWAVCPAPLLDISSTYIRARIRAGGELAGLVPQAVLQVLAPDDLKALATPEHAETASPHHARP